MSMEMGEVTEFSSDAEGTAPLRFPRSEGPHSVYSAIQRLYAKDKETTVWGHSRLGILREAMSGGKSH